MSLGKLNSQKLKRHIGYIETQLRGQKAKHVQLKKQCASIKTLELSSSRITALTEELAKAKAEHANLVAAKSEVHSKSVNPAPQGNVSGKKLKTAKKIEQEHRINVEQCRNRLAYVTRYKHSDDAIEKAQIDLAYAEKELWHATCELDALLGISQKKTESRRVILTLDDKKARISAATQDRLRKEKEREQKYMEEITAFRVALCDWQHAADAIRGRFLVSHVAFGGLITETVQRAQRIVAVGEFHHLDALAYVLCELNKAVSLGTPDPVNAFLRVWHANDAPWHKWASYPREAVMLAILAARLATEAQKLAASKKITRAAYVIARAVEAVTKAELSHDLVAANVAFYLLAERAMKVGEEEGRQMARQSTAAAGAAARSAKFEDLKMVVYELARRGDNGMPWRSRR